MQYTPLDQLDRKHFTKGSRNTQQNGAAEQMSSKKEIALMEAKLQRICELLKEVSLLKHQMAGKRISYAI